MIFSPFMLGLVFDFLQKCTIFQRCSFSAFGDNIALLNSNFLHYFTNNQHYFTKNEKIATLMLF